MSEFKGSIAQVNVQFPIETVIEPIAGENYSRAIIFMHLDLASVNLPGVDSPSAGLKVELDSSTYEELTGDKLKKWLTPFFTSAQAAKVAVALYDTDTTSEVDDGAGGTTTVTTPAVSPLGAVYDAYKYWAYFKFMLATSENEQDEQVNLAVLCLADPLYSRLWVGLSDSDVLTKSSALVTALKNAKANARVIYNPDTDINPALSQLGDSLAVINSTGTPVGNDIDGHAFNNGTKASGGLDSDGNRVNLTATQKSALDEQKIGYNTWCGDGTENVVTEGSLTLEGNVECADWIKHYIEYLCKIKSANYMTQRNRFRNNAEYQATLAILSDVVKPFVDFGRFANFVITAPTFSNLPASADSFTVPNAWKAHFIDRIRNITVYGTLYVTKPSK